MDDFKKDLLDKKGKSTFRIVTGILFLVLSITWVIIRIVYNQIIRPFDWLYFGLFALNGVMHLYEGFGFSIAGLFGKAYVSIDDKLISIKPGITKKEQNIYWKDIKTIDYKTNKYIVKNTDNTAITLDMSIFDYVLKNEIKGIIDSIAKRKNKQTIY